MYKLQILVFSGLFLLVGCDDKVGGNEVKSSMPSSTPASIIITDPLGPRYEATLQEGIDFKKLGYPSFLVDIQGVSNYEPWGRWSDIKQLSFKFKEPLPKAFILSLNGGAFGPNIGKAFKIKIGFIEKEVVFTSDPFNQPQTYRVAFKLDKPSDTIQMIVPEPTSPSKDDLRKLGLGLIFLKIEKSE